MLDKDRLKQKIKDAREHQEETDSEQAWDRFADKLAAAIIDEIKQAKINYTSGLIAPSGAVTGAINHTIS